MRLVASLAALPLAPLLWREHFLWLVLMRPSYPVVLAGAFLAREHEMNLLAVIGAAIPLQIATVWLFYSLGRMYRNEMSDKEKMPTVLAKLLHRDQAARVQRVLRERGVRFVILSRFAFFPIGVVAVAAGSSEMSHRRFLFADVAGALLAGAIAVGGGFGLGVAYHQGQPWLAGAGVAAMLGVAGLLTWSVRRERKRDDDVSAGSRSRSRT